MRRESVAVFASPERADEVTGIMGRYGPGATLVWAEDADVAPMLADLARRGFAVAVVDDESLPGDGRPDEAISEYAFAPGSAMRVVFLASPDRPADDPCLKRLVAAGVRDIVVPSAGHVARTVLPRRIAVPALPSDVAGWADEAARQPMRRRWPLGGRRAAKRRARHALPPAPQALPGFDDPWEDEPPEPGPEQVPEAPEEGPTAEFVDYAVLAAKVLPLVREEVAAIATQTATAAAEAAIAAGTARRPSPRKRTLAVAGTRPGAGATHTAFACALWLAARKAKCALVLSDPDEWALYASSVVAKAEDRFRLRGVDVFRGCAPSAAKGDYDAVVVDCAVLYYARDVPEPNIAAFNLADARVVVTGTSLPEAADLKRFVAEAPRGPVSSAVWAFADSGEKAMERTAAFLKDALKADELRWAAAPHSPDLLDVEADLPDMGPFCGELAPKRGAQGGRPAFRKKGAPAEGGEAS